MKIKSWSNILSTFSKRIASKKMAVGVDVSTKSIKAVVLKKKANKIILENYSIASSNKPLLEVGQMGVVNDFTGKVVASVLKNANIKNKHINVAMPSFASLIVTIEVPYIAGKEFDMAIKKEVAKYIPVKIDEVVYDWQIIDGSQLNQLKNDDKKYFHSKGREVGRGNKVRILVIAVMKEISDKYGQVFKNNNLEIDLLEIDSISLTRALTHNKEGVYLILDVGYETTNILIASAEGVLVNRTIDIGGNKMTQVIADSLKIDFERAEQMKIEQGIKVRHNSRGGNVLEPILSIFIEEIKKTIDLFQKDFFTVSINKVFLSGGVATMIGLREFIQSQIGLEVAVGNAFAGISFRPEIKEALVAHAPSLSIAVGLALANFEE